VPAPPHSALSPLVTVNRCERTSFESDLGILDWALARVDQEIARVAAIMEYTARVTKEMKVI